MNEAEPALAEVVAPSQSVGRSPVRFLSWRKEWSFGIELLDVDHRTMGDLIDFIANRFGPAAHRDTQSPSELQHWLYVLGDRTRAHFSREETLMSATGYPELLEHKREHTLMMAEYTAMVREIVARGTSRLLPDDLASLKDWFLGHLLYMDKRLAHHLSIVGATGAH